MGLTRFGQRAWTLNGTKITADGPVSGAIQVMPMVWDIAVAGTTTTFQQVNMPAGMKFKVVDAIINVGTVTNTPIISVGTTAGGTQIAVTTLAATGTAATSVMTVKAYDPAAAGLIDVRIVAASGEALDLPVGVTLVGYTYNAPTSLRQTTGSGTAAYR